MLDGGALKTPIGLKIDEATFRDLPATDWSLNLEICDMITSAQDGPQQAVKAVRARLQQRDDKVVDNVLILLDTLVKNCGRRFHLLIATRDFMCDLIRLVSPRDPTPQHVKDRALTLIERYSDAFKNDKDLSAVGEAYQYLKSQKVPFPPQNFDDMVAIHTPRASHPVIDPPSYNSLVQTTAAAAAPTNVAGYAPATNVAGYAPATNVVGYAPATNVAGYTPVTLAPQPLHPPPPVQGNTGYHQSGISHNDLQRLNKELLVVRGNDSVINDILADLQSTSNPGADELHLLRELHRTCKDMHMRMVGLLELVEEEGLVCQLLDLIDKLNNTFIRYDRYERNLTMSDGPGGAAPPSTTQPITQLLAQSTVQQRATPTSQQQEPAGNIYATPVQQPTRTQTTQRRPDIEELLSLTVPEPVYTEPTSQHPYDQNSSTNPFQEFIDAPISRLPSATGNDDDENIYTTEPAKIPAAKPADTEDIHLSLEGTVSGLHGLSGTVSGEGTVSGLHGLSGGSAVDDFDMFAQSRSSTLSDRAQASGSEVAYEAAHDVPQIGSLAGAIHSSENQSNEGSPADPADDRWLHDLNTVETTSQAMSNEEFDRFLNEHAPAPPTSTLHAPAPPTSALQNRSNKRREEDDLLAL